jgi:hypothetical protein
MFPAHACMAGELHIHGKSFPDVLVWVLAGGMRGCYNPFATHVQPLLMHACTQAYASCETAMQQARSTANKAGQRLLQFLSGLATPPHQPRTSQLLPTSTPPDVQQETTGVLQRTPCAGPDVSNSAATSSSGAAAATCGHLPPPAPSHSNVPLGDGEPLDFLMRLVHTTTAAAVVRQGPSNTTSGAQHWM